MNNNRESFEALKAEIHMARDTNEILSLANKKFIEEIEAQAKRIEELEAATEHLGLTPKQAADGLARYKAQVAEIESLREQVKDLTKCIDDYELETCYSAASKNGE